MRESFVPCSAACRQDELAIDELELAKLAGVPRNAPLTSFLLSVAALLDDDHKPAALQAFGQRTDRTGQVSYCQWVALPPYLLNPVRAADTLHLYGFRGDGPM